MAKPKLKVVPKEIRLDIGCGKHKREGFHGVDAIAFDGVDTILDVGNDSWPWVTSSVTEIHASHFVEHLTAQQRIHFVNEAHRVLIKDGVMTIITPHWASGRAYGDPTHQWPPVAEMWYYYLDPKWREDNAPHTDIKHNPKGFKCHFDCTWGYGMHGMLATRNQEFQQFAINFYKEAAQDLHATLKAKK
jgi:hypothetical protein